jgi:hypothetical protein
MFQEKNMNQVPEVQPVRGNSVLGLQDQRMRPMDDVISYVRQYAREKPDVAALWCFGIGFILGWKLKPW